MNDKIKILSEKIVYEGFLRIKTAQVEHELPDGTKINYERSKMDREDAVAVMVYNENTKKFFFVKQLRYPITGKADNYMTEIPAGRIDRAGTPLQTAIREVEEEIGYRVKPENIFSTINYFSSPGYSSEMLYLFQATVFEEDKVSDGGGVEEEDEHLEIVEFTREEMINKLTNGEFQDGKSVIAILSYCLQELTQK
jgi:GDP-mannose pyrophosphatase NudK